MKQTYFLIVFAAFTGAALADDGIWLVNEFPRSIVKSKYGFEVSDSFLRNLQLGSVRFNNGGSGSFVSQDGLVFTNHHVASDCIQKLSTASQDLMRDGFHARTREAEKRCPDLELNVLLKIENVTEQVKSSTPADATPARAAQLRRASMSAIEKTCADRTRNRCDVVTLFSGGQYHLYEYEKYTDIRLVFAPEKDIAFFGGDPDNFVYPRWNLDVAFFRAYRDGKAVTPLHYFPWSKNGIRKGELTFVSGNPGSTGRLLTFAELEMQRDVQLPTTLGRLKSLIAALKEYSKLGPEQARVALEEIFGNENSYKAASGFYSGLQDPEFMARKKAAESKLQAAINSNPDLKAKYGTVWAEIEAIAKANRELYTRLAALEGAPNQYGSILPIARIIYRLADETAKPDASRLREFASAGLSSLEAGIYSDAPLDKGLEKVILEQYLLFLVKSLEDKNPVVLEVLEGRAPSLVAEAVISGTKLFTVAERKRLAAASLEERLKDPLLRLVSQLDVEARRVRKQSEDQVQSRQSIETARLAQAQYALGGTIYPDATFTFRVSFGPAIGYKDKAGKAIPWMTDFKGMYAHATGVDPLALPKRWLDARKKLNLTVPFNYVTTADTHGGNSGSPTVNTKGEIVGILFDGNLEGLPNRYLFTDERARSVHVASQGVREALVKVYSATELLKELGF